MEKNEPQQPLTPAEAGDSVDIIARAKANSKLIMALSVFICAVIIGIFVWYFVSRSGAAKADEAISRADIEQNDSIALQLYKEAATHGYKSGNRARLEVATRLYEQGDYQGALDYVKDASFSDNIVKSGALALQGDCYVNLKQYPQAIDCYKDAVKISDNNPHYTPAFLLKEATVLREQKDFKAEAAIYEEILNNYPNYGSEIGVDIKKYLERAQDAASK